MPEQQLEQGESVFVEFDRLTAQVGIELVDASATVGAAASEEFRIMAPGPRISEDFSASAYVVEFVVLAASGITVAAATALIQKLIGERASRRTLTVKVELLHKAPGDTRLVLGVTQSDSDDD